MAAMNLLLVEDDMALIDSLSRSLTARGFSLMCSADGLEALQLLRKRNFDAVVLDLTLPHLDGLELLVRLRAGGCRVPVLVLTARSAVHERVAGLNAGADDYLAKPFDLEELLARLFALLRRFGGEGDLRCGILHYDAGANLFYRNEIPVDLSPREQALLRALMSRVNRAVTKEDLCAEIFGQENMPLEAVEVLVHRLRKKIQNCHVDLLTLRGVGYLISDEFGASKSSQKDHP